MGLGHFDVNMVRAQHYLCLCAQVVSLQTVLPLAFCVKTRVVTLKCFRLTTVTMVVINTSPLPGKKK